MSGYKNRSSSLRGRAAVHLLEVGVVNIKEMLASIGVSVIFCHIKSKLHRIVDLECVCDWVGVCLNLNASK